MNPSVSGSLRRSLARYPWGPAAAPILERALAAVDPRRRLKRSLERDGDRLILPDGTRRDLGSFRDIILIAVGKAALPLGEGALDLLGDRISRGICIGKYPADSGGALEQAGIPYLTAGHPLPNQDSLRAGERVLSLAETAGEGDLVLVLLSGGGSALLEAPAPGLDLEDLLATQRSLLRSGAEIEQINTVRKQLSRLKGGRLAARVHPAQLITLALSDVLDDRPDVIASGPTAPDHTSPEQARDVIRNHHLETTLPPAVWDHLKTKGTGEGRRSLNDNQEANPDLFGNYYIIGNNRTAAREAVHAGRKEGFHSLLLTTRLEGEAQEIGRACGAVLTGMARDGDPVPRPGLLVAGGETTVSISPDTVSGQGGRNLELALAAVENLRDIPGCALITLATDGDDGSTNAAGAVVTGKTADEADQQGMEPAQFLAEHDSQAFFQRLNGLIHTGPTHTNVNDLVLLFTFPEDSV